MNINIFFKGFKQQNTYSDRGNYFGARECSNTLQGFKNYIINFTRDDTVDTVDTYNINEPDLKRIQEIFRNITIKLINSELVDLKLFNEPHINIINNQNKMQREKIEALSRFKNGSDINYDIIFDRSPAAPLTPNPDNNLMPEYYYSNGYKFARKANKKFMPRFFGEIYKTNKMLNQYRLGIYFRPDVCPLQVRNIKNYLEHLYKLSKRSYNKIVILPIIYMFGKRIELDYPFQKHTVNKKEFFSNIDGYMYSPMEIDDPLPNTLFEACVNTKDIFILKSDINNYPGMLGIDEIEEYCSLATDKIHTKVFTFTYLDMDVGPAALKIFDEAIYSTYKTDYIYNYQKFRIQSFFIKIINISKLVFTTNVIMNLTGKYYFSDSDIDLIHDLLARYTKVLYNKREKLKYERMEENDLFTSEDIKYEEYHSTYENQKIEILMNRWGVIRTYPKR